MSDNPAGLTPTNTEATGATPEAANTTPNGATPEGNPQAQTVESLPDWAQDLIKGLRKENEKRRKQADDERTQAEEKRLAEEKKWQELAEQRARERDDLKPYKDRYEALAASRRAELLAEVQKWPAEVKALLPGEDADVSALADAVTKGRALVAALAGKQEAAGGQGPNPKPAGMGRTELDAAARRQAAAFYRDF